MLIHSADTKRYFILFARFTHHFQAAHSQSLHRSLCVYVFGVIFVTIFFPTSIKLNELDTTVVYV